MNSRRLFLQHSITTSSALLLGISLNACGGGGGGSDENGANTGETGGAGQNSGGSLPAPASGWLMPDETAAHKATWMAFAASAAIWGNDMVRPVQQTLARIANAIVPFEPVNMLVSQNDLALAQQMLDPRIKLLLQEIDDLWIRDTGPVFVVNQNGDQAGINFNFNGWGRRQTFAKDARVASFVTQQTGRQMLSSKLVLEGGGIEVDGKGTAIITESCVLNPNRNPGLGKADCEAELNRLLGIRKVIWLPGIAGKDITDGHTDFYARFARPGTVIAAFDADPASYDHAVTQRHLEILRGARDADNQPLQVTVIEAPAKVRPEYDHQGFAAGYINFYLANGAVLVPEFGDEQADANAKARLMQLYPGRTIVQLNIDPIAAGGGGIHCTTQQQPA